jgi:hypothetical protein
MTKTKNRLSNRSILSAASLAGRAAHARSGFCLFDPGAGAEKEELMHSTIAELSSLEREYLNAIWQYHGDRSSSDKDVAISKEVFRLIKAGLYELAAIEAGKSDVALEIWTNAVNAANIKDAIK